MQRADSIYGGNYEQLTIKLILENPKLRELREESIKENLKMEVFNAKARLKEVRKAEQEEPVKTEKEQF